MRRETLRGALVLIVLLYCCMTGPGAGAQGYVPPMTIELRDEGTTLGRARALNCTGAGLTCSVTAGVGTIDGSAGGGGGLTHPQVMSRASLGF